MKLRSTWDWSLEYVGDPLSWAERGEMFLTLLRDEGLKPHHRVLELGCGNLSAGVPLIRFLNHGRFVGLEPNGWLVNAAIERFPDLPSKSPTFLYRTDFNVADEKEVEADGPFDFVLAHSVLSHVAYWQMSKVLHETRRVVEKEAVWLATVRLGEDDFAANWAYPGVNHFSSVTIEVLAHHMGWVVRRMYDYEERLQAVAPNDVHELLRFEAVTTTEEINELRLEMEARKAEVEEEKMEQRMIYIGVEKAKLKERDAE